MQRTVLRVQQENGSGSAFNVVFQKENDLVENRRKGLSRGDHLEDVALSAREFVGVQVPDAEICLVASGSGIPTSALLLRR